MSADNWTRCPKCSQVQESAHSEALRNLEASYGKLPAAEYAKRVRDLEEMVDIADLQVTLREDYEFYGIEDGVLNISYSALCTSCDWTFNHSQEIEVLKP